MVDSARYDNHVIVGAVEDWVENLRHFEDVIIRWFANHAWLDFGCFREQIFDVGCHCGWRLAWLAWRVGRGLGMTPILYCWLMI